MSLDIMGTIFPISGMDTNSLISEIEAFASSKGIAPATVTSRAVKNSRLYDRMKSGGSCTIRVAEKLRAYMAAASEAGDAASEDAA